MTTLRTTVYLNEAPGSFLGFDSQRAILNMAASFDLDIADHLSVPAAVEAARETVFEQLNIDDPNHTWAQYYRLAGHRSLSVGDVVVIGETAWAVEDIGWRTVSTATLATARIR